MKTPRDLAMSLITRGVVGTITEAVDQEKAAVTRRARNSRRKGSTGERELVKILTEAGLKARRVPLSGAMSASGFGGDVLVEDTVVRCVSCSSPAIRHEAAGGWSCLACGARGRGAEEIWEVKRRAGAFVLLERWLEDAAVVAFRRDNGTWMVTLRLEDYLSDRVRR